MCIQRAPPVLELRIKSMHIGPALVPPSHFATNSRKECPVVAISPPLSPRPQTTADRVLFPCVSLKMKLADITHEDNKSLSSIYRVIDRCGQAVPMPTSLRTPRLSPRRTATHVQNAEMRRMFHGRFGIRYFRSYRQGRPVAQHPVPIR